MLALDFTILGMYFAAIYFAVFMFLNFFENGAKDKQVKKITTYPSVTVAIPVWNEEKSVIGTVKSVLDLDYPANKLTVMVVNDCSTDGTQQLVEDFIAHEYKGDVSLQLINHAKNGGKGKAINTALSKTNDEYFVCLDADSFIQPQALKEMLPHIQPDENIASVLPYMHISKFKGLIYRLQYIEYMVNFFLKKLLGAIDCIHVTPGPFALYRTNILKQLDGFSEDNLTEDLEMALRLQKHQYKIVQLLSAHVYTLPPKTIKAWYMQRNRWYKGTLINMYKYKSLFFNNKYGEFGFFQLPMTLLAALLSIFFAIFVLWKNAIYPLTQKVVDMSYVNFDYPMFTKVWMERFHMLDINYMLLYFLVTIIVIGVIWISLAHKYGRVSFLRKGLVNTVLYILIYPIFLSVVWIGIVFDLVRGKIQRW